jgi:hypothetical protein
MATRIGSWLVSGLVVLSFEAALCAQPAVRITPKLDEHIARLQKFLSTYDIDAAPFQQEMPLAKFLAELEKRLPKEMGLTIRLERKAFGDEADAIAGTNVSVPKRVPRLTVRAALHAALGKVKPRADYRLSKGEVVITLPGEALYQTEYEVGNLNPELLRAMSPAGSAPADLVQGEHAAAPLVQALRGLSSWLSPDMWRTLADRPDGIRLINGTRLEIHANPATHSEVYRFFRTLQRLGDVSVQMQARLYEVDDDFYSKLQGRKRVPLEELEKQFLNGGRKTDSLFESLAKQKLILAGPDVSVGNDAEATLLSWHSWRSLLPSPDQVRHGQGGRQGVLEGFAFQAGVQVSADRRQVRVKLREKSVRLEEVLKVKVRDLVEEQLKGKEKEVVAEIPFLKDVTHGTVLEIPDGGTVLTPVHYRPDLPRGAKALWVLAVHARIHIEEEEQQLRRATLADILDDVVADALKNPKLKAIRELQGTAAESRFALVDSTAWKWPKDFRIEAPDFQRTAPLAKGNRLLGLRVERYREPAHAKEPHAVTLTLFNAGGADNGPAIGGCTVRYLARPNAKGWAIELSEGLDP